jgi:hypothetical protein
MLQNISPGTNKSIVINEGEDTHNSSMRLFRDYHQEERDDYDDDDDVAD